MPPAQQPCAGSSSRPGAYCCCSPPRYGCWLPHDIQPWPPSRCTKKAVEVTLDSNNGRLKRGCGSSAAGGGCCRGGQVSSTTAAAGGATGTNAARVSRRTCRCTEPVLRHVGHRAARHELAVSTSWAWPTNLVHQVHLLSLLRLQTYPISINCRGWNRK